jgi:small subunit ribosomal protein S8
MTDPVADLLTRIRNGNARGVARVRIPYSRLKKEIVRVLKEQGFIADYASELDSSASESSKATLRVELKYGPDGEKVIRHIQRVSRPGRRVYKGFRDVPEVLNGLGVVVISTPKGVLSNLEAKRQRLGGEILCEVW